MWRQARHLSKLACESCVFCFLTVWWPSSNDTRSTGTNTRPPQPRLSLRSHEPTNVRQHWAVWWNYIAATYVVPSALDEGFPSVPCPFMKPHTHFLNFRNLWLSSGHGLNEIAFPVLLLKLMVIFPFFAYTYTTKMSFYFSATLYAPFVHIHVAQCKQRTKVIFHCKLVVKVCVCVREREREGGSRPIQGWG